MDIPKRFVEYIPSQEKVANASSRKVKPTCWSQTLNNLQVDRVEETSYQLSFRRGDAYPKRMCSLDQVQPFCSCRGVRLGQTMVEELADSLCLITVFRNQSYKTGSYVSNA